MGKNADQIKAEEIENKNPVTASTSQKLSQIKNTMEEKELRTIPVVTPEDKLEGAISYRDLIRYIQFNPKSTKISKVMHQPPEFDDDENLLELANLRINSGKKMLVNTQNNEIKGTVSDKEFLEAATNNTELENTSTKRIATRDVITVFEDDKIDKARHTMLDNNISTLPVVNNNGELTGILRSTDMLQLLITRESVNAGGTSGGRKTAKEVNIAGGIEKEKMSQVPVSEVMNRMPNIADEHCSASEAAEKILDKNSTELLITEDKYPEAIVTTKDLIRHLDDLNNQGTVLVQLIGLEVPEEKAALHDKIKKQLRGSLGRKLDNPEELSVHLKKSDKDGKKQRYDFTVKLYSELGLKTINVESWDLLEGMDEALNKLNKVVRTEKEKKQEHR